MSNNFGYKLIAVLNIFSLSLYRAEGIKIITLIEKDERLAKYFIQEYDKQKE
jgi:hypothetical protein